MCVLVSSLKIYLNFPTNNFFTNSLHSITIKWRYMSYVQKKSKNLTEISVNSLEMGEGEGLNLEHKSNLSDQNFKHLIVFQRLHY